MADGKTKNDPDDSHSHQVSPGSVSKTNKQKPMIKGSGHRYFLDIGSPRNLGNLSGAKKCCRSCHYRPQCDGNFTKHFHINVEELYVLKT